MSTSGTSIFNLEFTEIAEESWERAGRELRTGYDLRTARRSMNLMTIEWQNRGINMWTIEQGVINLVQGVNTYALPNDTIDLMEHVIRTGAGVEIADMNFRFLPCVVAGLAYYIAMKVPELENRIPMLKAAYDEQFNLAAGEDREKAAIRFVPRRSYIGGG